MNLIPLFDQTTDVLHSENVVGLICLDFDKVVDKISSITLLVTMKKMGIGRIEGG